MEEKSRGKAHPPAERKRAIRLLAINQGDVLKTAEQTKIPKRTLNRWKKSEDFVAALDDAISLYLERSMDDSAVRETSGYYAAQAVQQLVKTKQLLTGGPTDRLHMTGDLASFLSANAGTGTVGAAQSAADRGSETQKRAPGMPEERTDKAGSTSLPGALAHN